MCILRERLSQHFILRMDGSLLSLFSRRFDYVDFRVGRWCCGFGVCDERILAVFFDRLDGLVRGRSSAWCGISVGGRVSDGGELDGCNLDACVLDVFMLPR